MTASVFVDVYISFDKMILGRIWSNYETFRRKTRLPFALIVPFYGSNKFHTIFGLFQMIKCRPVPARFPLIVHHIREAKKKSENIKLEENYPVVADQPSHFNKKIKVSLEQLINANTVRLCQKKMPEVHLRSKN